jgi:tocopherol cyclase
VLERLRNTWHPENFHYAHALGRAQGFFEGWYFKLVDSAGVMPMAVIPGVFLGPDAHAFIQVLDGRAGRSWYHRFELGAFSADRRRFELRIGRSRFGADRISLDIGAQETAAGQAITGTIALGPWAAWPVRPTSPGAMGPYGFMPFMECYHGILSLDHHLEGRLEVDGARRDYDGGRGYLEKDWGRGFPLAYVWAQSNHFDRPGICVTASVARIPWLRGAFRGLLAGFLLEGRLYRFTTYTGARVEALNIGENRVGMVIRDRRHRVEMEVHRTQAAVLHAPYERRMLERISETMTSEIALRFGPLAGAPLYEGVGRSACLEVQGDPRALSA